MTTAHMVRVKIEVNRDMLDAAHAACPVGQALTDQEITAIYKSMRAVEPGTPDPGVMRHVGMPRG